MEIGACSDIGKVRELNEDAYYMKDNGLNLFIVADGMGGHNAGEVASQIAIETIKNAVEQKMSHHENTKEFICNVLREAITEANLNIYTKALQEESYQGMGTTLTMAYVSSKLYIGHVGDSRAYVIQNDEILQVTQDHSLVAELLRNGSITESEAKIHPQRNIITRALGTDERVDIDVLTLDINYNDIIVLCTDGLSNLIDTSEIKHIFLNCKTIQQGCEHLVTLANERGGYDNITVLAIRNI